MHHLSASELHEKFIDGSLSSEAIVSHYLKRIDRLDGQVGSLLAVFSDKAMEKARRLDKRRSKGEKLGRLAGIPYALKDNIHAEGELTTCGSKFLTNYRAVFDSTVNHLLEREDAILMGKTNLDEFAMGSSTENSALKITRNPWNLECVPGGSSGGSAAAVAGRLCPLTFGSDTGGSIRQPAGLCGIVGFKPTYGRVSRYGLVAFGSSLDQIGPLAISTKDIGKVMEIIGQHDPKDATSITMHAEDYVNQFDGKIAGKKIGVPFEFLKDLSTEAKQNFDQSIEALKALGAEIVEVDLNILRYSVATYYILATAEASTNLARFDGIRYGQRSKRAKTLDEVYDFSKEEGFGPEVKKRILLGTFVLSSGYQDAYYKKAQRVRAKIIKEYAQAFEKCDVIATPVSPLPAFKIGEIQDPLQMYLQDIYTIGVNLGGLPGVSIPSGFNKEGKPWGLQLVGAPKEDSLVLRIAYAFESKTKYNLEIPDLFKE